MQQPGTGIAEVIPGQAGNMGEVQADNEVPACTLPSHCLESLHFRNTNLRHGAVPSWVKIPVNSDTVPRSIFPSYMEQNGLPFKEIEFFLWVCLHKHNTYSFCKVLKKTQIPKPFGFVF